MFPDTRYLEIAKGLLEKTRKNKVAWEQEFEEDNSYYVRLPESRIELKYRSPSTEPDFVQLAFFRPDGRLVGSWNVLDGNPQWQLALDLFSTVQRLVTRWDKVLEDVEKFIATDKS